jgi:probable F420-dependent oxidoreductase
MKLGVVFPQTEIGNDPVVIRDYAQAAEQLGYSHILVFDHVLGARPDRFEALGFRPPYTYQTPFHEPLVLFGFLAGVTSTVELVTGILILPQRQTALVAKQAAAVDVLTGGRLRLGVGIGWNHVEYEALGENFKNRGRRVEEQIALLRALWTRELVDFEGKYHHLSKAGINPLPVQRPIPIWMGGMSEPVLKRAARMADGWFPQFRPGPQSTETLERFRGYVSDAGRKVEDVGIEGRISVFNTPEAEWAAALDGWRDLAASHVSFNTMNVGLASPQAHIDAIRRFWERAAPYRDG